MEESYCLNCDESCEAVDVTTHDTNPGYEEWLCPLTEESVLVEKESDWSDAP